MNQDLNDFFRKFYKKYFLFLISGLLMLYFVWNNANKVISTIVGGAGILLIIIGLTLLSQLFSIQSIIKNEEQVYNEPFSNWNKNKVLVIRILVIASIIINFSLAKQYENYIGYSFLTNNILIGFIISSFVYLLSFKFLDLVKLSITKTELAIICYFFITIYSIGMPLLIQKFSNTKYVEEKKIKLLKANNKYIHILLNGQKERFLNNNRINYNNVDSIDIEIKENIFGYKFLLNKN